METAGRVVWCVTIEQARAAMSHPDFCGLSRQHLGELAGELAPRWVAPCVSGRHGRREGDGRREAGTGPKYEPVFIDRLPVTLVHLRTWLTHEELGVLYEVGSSTIGRAIRDVRPLPAGGARDPRASRVSLWRDVGPAGAPAPSAPPRRPT